MKMNRPGKGPESQGKAARAGGLAGSARAEGQLNPSNQ